MNAECDKHPLSGIHAATVCPLDADGELHENDLSRHVASVSAVSGIRGLLVNGHAGEGGLLDRDERQAVLTVVKASVATDTHLCAGVFGESTASAVQAARDAVDGGADSVLVFPPNAWALGHDAAMALTHHRAIADACGLPIVLYKAPLAAARMSYDMVTLRALIEIDAVVAIKEGSWEVAAYEESLRTVQGQRPEVAVLGSGDEHLFTSYVIGSVGSQVSLAAIVPGLVVDLHAAVKAGDLHQARAFHELVYPLALAIYRTAPTYQATARLKCALALLGRIGDDGVKAPYRQCEVNERNVLRGLVNGAEYEPYYL